MLRETTRTRLRGSNSRWIRMIMSWGYVAVGMIGGLMPRPRVDHQHHHHRLCGCWNGWGPRRPTAVLHECRLQHGRLLRDLVMVAVLMNATFIDDTRNWRSCLLETEARDTTTRDEMRIRIIIIMMMMMAIQSDSHGISMIRMYPDNNDDALPAHTAARGGPGN